MLHLLTGLVGTASSGLSGMIIVGLCCNLVKGSRMIRWGEWPIRLAKARSGFEVVSHLPELKLSGCLGSCKSCTPDDETQSSSVNPSGFVELYPM